MPAEQLSLGQPAPTTTILNLSACAAVLLNLEPTAP